MLVTSSMGLKLPCTLLYKVGQEVPAVPIPRNSLRLVTFIEWLMVLPATVFLTAAVLRLLQPPEYEPARTSWVIVGWTVRNISRSGAAVLLLGLPALVALVGGAALALNWRTDETLRRDATAIAATIWRHGVVVWLGAAAVLAVAIVVLVVGHSVAHLPR
jgi:hypothetical protein